MSSKSFTVMLDNQGFDDDEPSVIACVYGPGAAKWAKEDQTILGAGWESDESDFAYVIISDFHFLEEALVEEGYVIDTSCYVPPPMELKDQGRRR